MTRHFLDLSPIGAEQIRAILDHAAAMKQARGQGAVESVLAGRKLAMIFEKPSTRTRVSFDVGMRELGGETIVLNGDDMQIGRGESIADTARVLSRYVDIIMLRATEHSHLTDLAEYATVPVINGLTDRTHPCQIMADILTYEEHVGPIKNAKVAWCGDGNNVAASWIEAAALLDFELTLACPEQLPPAGEIMDWARARGGRISLTTDPEAAVAGADCVVTDCWVSMGDADAANRHNLLQPYQVNSALMDKAGEKAVFMHCLPAHRGEEVTAEVIDGSRSVVFDEAENRLHAQKAVLAWCLSQG
ncbi:MAG: ornithine carbamoyltransferase [Hyphomicrobiales bacterium]|nr:MAG: ornithine carbamoyltransferase [Hyphomicrobiales bacterium]